MPDSRVSRLEPSPGAARLAPIARQTLNKSVYAELRRALVHGSLHSGQVLGIVELAQTLGTSTMPVREALGRLVAEKALEPLPNRSVRVPPITVGRLDDLLRARLLVEGMAVELAAQHITDWEIQRLKAALESHDQTGGSVDDITRQNYEFHFLIYQASGSDVLLSIIESLWLQSGPIVWEATKAFSPTSDLTSTEYHHELADAISLRNVAAARSALEADIGRAFSLLRAQLDQAESRKTVSLTSRKRPV